MAKDEDQAQHKDEMEKQQQAVKERVAQADIDKGVLIVLTGDGKGKSSSAFGMVLRCLGHGMKVGVVQFIKGQWKTGEQKFFQQHPDVSYFQMGGGFTWDTQDKQGDMERAESCWSEAERLLKDPKIELVVLDELNVVTSFEYLPIEKVLAGLKARPDSMHVVVTGRGAHPQLRELADTITEIESPKHAFNDGIRAQKGLEF